MEGTGGECGSTTMPELVILYSCWQCTTDANCAADHYVCNGNTIMLHDNYCDQSDHTCKETVSTVKDCNDYNQAFCSDSYHQVNQTGTCVNGNSVCTVTNSSPGDCRDNLACNGVETCSAGSCVAGTPPSCSQYDISGITTCDNNPDNYHPTWDYRCGFTSQCVENGNNQYHCTTGDNTTTHTCSVVNCSAECDATHSCVNKCVGDVRYFGGVCADNCTCSYLMEGCPNDGNYCNGTNVDTRDYYCTPDGCQYTITNTQSCDDGNPCTADSCSAGRCVNTPTPGQSCDDGLFCSVDDICTENGQCIGQQRDCSGNNLCEIATCNNDPDNRSQTFDYAAAFTSVCDDAIDNCTTSSYAYTHTCADANSTDGGPNIDGMNPAVCTAECDTYGVECTPHIVEQNKYCYYSGRCNTDCACAYSGEYCPDPGNVTNDTCYFGTRDCNDKDGCTLSDREMTCYDTCNATNGPIDTSGPVVVNRSVYPNPAGPMCLQNATINATAVENCSHIHDAEFYVYLTNDPQATCQSGGSEVRWGKMYAVDGTYDDDQIEKINGSFSVLGMMDGGGYKYCLKAQNDNGTWGNCECRRLEVDNLHPVLVNDSMTPVHWTDSYGNWVCADNFTYSANFCDQPLGNGQSCIAGAEYFVKPPQDWDWNSGTGHPMLPADGAFGEYQTTCDVAYDNVTNTAYTEGTHELKSEALDCACNWGKLLYQTPIKFVIDRTPPVSAKTVGEPKIQCNYLGEQNEAEACWFIKTSTLVNLSAQDVNPNGADVISDNVTIKYRYRWKYNYSDSWGDWSDLFNYTTPFSFTNDSIHELEYYSVDRCGNEETHHFEIDIVDTQAPDLVKTITGPQVQGSGDVHMYLTDNSVVKLECIDKQPHPVDEETLHWEMYWKQNSGDSWQLVGSGTEESYKEFARLNDSYHKFVYWCTDALGNTGANQTEIDIVDSQPPVSNKTVGNPKIACPPGYAEAYSQYPTDGCYFINESTMISLSCNDQNPHPVGGETIYYRYRVTGEFGEWMQYTGPFHYDEDSMHMLEWYCVDALNNTEQTHSEMDVVDSLPPISTKNIDVIQHQDPTNVTWIRQDSIIHLTCSDLNPHPSGESFGVTIYYRYSLDGGPFTNWTSYNGWTTSFHYNEDSNHTLEWYCVDALNNTEQMHTELDRVDTTPPVTNKTYGTPFYTNGVSDWITSQTPITLTATDGGAICHVGINDMDYKVTLVDNSYCENDTLCQQAGCESSETCGIMGSPEPNDTVTFTIPEDSCHLIEFYSVDQLSNVEPIKKQCVYVDNTPPVVNKTLTEPKVPYQPTQPIQYSDVYDVADPAWYINQSTMITLSCADSQPHPVGGEEIYYKYYVDGVLAQDWMQYTVPFNYNEDTIHELYYYCKDRFNNTSPVHVEVDVVDSQPPLINKTITGQQDDAPEPFHVYLNNLSTIKLNCTDQEPHPAGDEMLYWEMSWKENLEDEWQLIGSGAEQGYKEFTGLNDSYHKFVYWCTDALGNTGANETELDIVDAKKPVSNKTLGEPKRECTPEEQTAYYGGMMETDGCYFVNSSTPITITCTDQEPHPSGVFSIRYIYWIINETPPGSYTVVNRQNSVTFYLPDDSAHILKWYCVDEVNNMETEHVEFDIVDNQPPETTKAVVGPQVKCDAEDPTGCDYYLSQYSRVQLRCADTEPHPVDHSRIYYRYRVDGGNWTEWMDPPAETSKVINFTEESVHELQYYCVDALNNTEEVHNETDKVDNTPPVTTKIISGCYTPCTAEDKAAYNGCNYWVGSSAEIGLSAQDGGVVCAVGVDYTRYRHKNDGSGWNPDWGNYNQNSNINFSYPPYNFEGYQYFEYYSVDKLGNAEVKHNETDIYDDDDPFGFVLNPVSGHIYHDGETFEVYAPAADAGHPPSGVANCEFYAIDINYEGINQSQIHSKEQFEHALQLNHVNYTLVYLGQVPYVDGVCKGTATIPNPSNITDKAYLMIRITDRSCNEWFGYARDDLENGRKIIMDFDNEAPRVIITDRDGLLNESAVEDNHHFVVHANVTDYNSGADECWADLYKVTSCEECESNLEFIKLYPGVMNGDYQCTVDGVLPVGLEDGTYQLTVSARDGEFNIGNDSVRFQVDGTPPTKALYLPDPTKLNYYGPNGILIKIGMNDTTVGVDPATVQYRIYNSTDLDAICLGNCYDSKWRNTTLAEGDQWVGNYTATFNVSAENITSGTYYMRMRGCDMLYPPPLPTGTQLPAHCIDPWLSIIIDIDPPQGPYNVIIDGKTLTWDSAVDNFEMKQYNIYFDGVLNDTVNSTAATNYTYTTTNTSVVNISIIAFDMADNNGSEVFAQPKSTPPAEPTCGDGLCNGVETCTTCSKDCGICHSGGGSSGGSSSGTVGTTGGTSSTGGSTGGTATFTQCSSLGQPCAVTSDCCGGQCVNYKCAVPEEAGPATRVDILAPPSALLNDVVVLKLVDENGTPVAGGTVLIISPTRESLVLLTDTNGEAGFRATDEGVYNYNAPGHYMVSIRTTNVVKPTEPIVNLEEEPIHDTRQATPPSLGMALASFAPWVVGLIALLLIALFLATRRKKEKKEKK